MKKIFSVIILLLSLILLTCCTQIGNEKYLKDTNTITVIKTDDYYTFKSKNYDTGIIFYPKNDINYINYAPLMHKLADTGYIVFLLKDNSDKNTKTIIFENKNITNWYIGGHSSGGIKAANYLENNSTQFNGVFLLASFSNIDLSQKNLKILTVYGENDKILNQNTYNTKKLNLGDNYLEKIISGGNHTLFANIPTLENDGKATITHDEQIEKTIKYIVELINSQLPTQEPIPVQTTIQYTESIETFTNPDRGFYEPAYIPTNIYEVGNVKEKLLYPNSLIHLRIDLSTFSSKYNNDKDLELTENMLSSLDNLFEKIDASEACTIVRFAYDNEYNGNVDMEPKISMILKHIEQFTPIINKYKHMITALECGLIGPWGEMHSSVIANQTTYNQILDKYLKCLDKDIKLLVRRPKFIYKYYGYSLENLEYFNFENNRLGCYNDGYLGSFSDLGTFDNRELEIAFLEKLNKNFPYGGEVTMPESPYNQLSWACDEMFKTNLNYLNLHWNDKVIERWKNTKYLLDDPLYKDSTEFKYIENHMGYRFVCKYLRYSITEHLNINLQIKNVGFGELYKHKTGYIILQNETEQYIYNFEYNNELSISQNVSLDNVKTGNYELYFVLADNFTDHSIRGIRFGNTDMYNDEIKANKLADISIK